MSRAFILYCVAAVQLIAGLYILIDAHPNLQSGEITAITFIVRGLGPLILAATFIFLARQMRANEGLDDA